MKRRRTSKMSIPLGCGQEVSLSAQKPWVSVPDWRCHSAGPWRTCWQTGCAALPAHGCHSSWMGCTGLDCCHSYGALCCRLELATYSELQLAASCTPSSQFLGWDGFLSWCLCHTAVLSTYLEARGYATFVTALTTDASRCPLPVKTLPFHRTKCWTSKSSGTWHHDTEAAVPNVSKDCSAFSFEDLSSWPAWPWRWRQYPSKRLQLPAQRCHIPKWRQYTTSAGAMKNKNIGAWNVSLQWTLCIPRHRTLLLNPHMCSIRTCSRYPKRFQTQPPSFQNNIPITSVATI